MSVNIAELFKQMRKGVSMREIAKKTGLSISYLYDIENGRTTPSIETLEKLAKAFDTELVIGFRVTNDARVTVWRKDLEEIQDKVDKLLGARE